MRTKQLGKTDLNLTIVGLGTWAIGGAGWQFSWGEQDDRDSVATIIKALELGVNWIDTAPVYGLGHAEEIVGRAIREYGERPIVATKCGLLWDADGQITRKHTAATIRSEVEASLKRLQVDVIDLYQIHWPEPDQEIEEAWETMLALCEEGKVRNCGVSNFSLQQLVRAQAVGPVASLQPPYSMLDRNIERELLNHCQQEGIGVVCYSPMQKGVLTDKFTRDFVKGLAADDHRIQSDPNFKEPKLSGNLELVDLLRGIARKKNCTVAQLAIAWALRRNEVTAAIVGARRPSQIEESCQAGQCQFEESDLAVIEMFMSRRS